MIRLGEPSSLVGVSACRRDTLLVVDLSYPTHLLREKLLVALLDPAADSSLPRAELSSAERRGVASCLCRQTSDIM